MPNDMPLEARMVLIHEILLAVGNNEYVFKAAGAREDFFNLSKAIAFDTKFACTTHHRLIGALKKTPVWPKILPFLENGDRKCRTCGHGDYQHGGYSAPGTTACHHTTHFYHGHNTPQTVTHCDCTGFVKRPMR